MGKKVLGIIGGMGPAATVMLFDRIVSCTKAASDAEHIHILIDNNTGIPDRTGAILSHSRLPLLEICKSGKKLVSMGAEILCIPCNTSHYFMDDIQKELSVPVIHMIRETALECRKRQLGKVGVLATDGTILTNIYSKELCNAGIAPLYPDPEDQKEIMALIYRYVKAGKEYDVNRAYPILRRMRKQGAEAFILGCTELPIGLRGITDYLFIDSLDVLARRSIEACGYEIK